MFSSKNAISDVAEIPSTWIFEHYLRLTDKLVGQDIKMKSVFNTTEKTPSMFIYFDSKHNDYRFKCFSTGLYGDATALVFHMKDVPYYSIENIIIQEYIDYLKGNTYEKSEVKIKSKWLVASYSVRTWNQDDAKFWSPYNISSKILDYYTVKPLSSLTLAKENESFSITGSTLYGYFTKKGELYRVYNPNNDKKKFMIFGNYLQGWDQVGNKNRLFICSSLKDIMSMRSLGINADYIAPTSENSTIDNILEWVNGYEEKYVIFDNDEAGIRMMQKYQNKYGIPFIHLKLSKDISDSVKDYGADIVKEYLKEYL
jgi:hypothetical protein